eukprot:10936946-Lingulodinium_polyedra.AAC.1
MMAALKKRQEEIVSPVRVRETGAMFWNVGVAVFPGQYALPPSVVPKGVRDVWIFTGFVWQSGSLESVYTRT